MAQNDSAPTMQVDLYSHNVKISQFNHIVRNALLEYCRSLAQYGLVRVGRGRFERKMLRVYVGVTTDRSEFHFHINQWHDLKRHLDGWGFPEKSMRIVEHPLYVPVACEFPMRDKRPPRDFQGPIIDYLVEPGSGKVVTLQTGRGKTFITLQAIHRIGQRTMLVIKGMYVDKWIEDVNQAFHMGDEDLMVVRGSNHLAALIKLALAGELKSKFIICTSKTMFMYLQSYEKFKDDDVGYQIPPEQLYETLGVGVRVIDEVHQDYHCNYRQDLYTHVPKTISLSATLDSDDKFLNRMYEINWPRSTRAPEVEYDRFIVMKCLWYSITEPKKIRHKNIMKQYSHVLFEQSIMKHPHMLRNYIDMIASIVMTSFIRVYEPGQKMLIFCATQEMCTLVSNHLSALHPSIKVNRYISDDEYEDLLTADIGVSTIQSAGTAVDIPNLRITLMTNALSSKQSNIQVLGRTRRLKDWPDVTPEFLFTSAREIDKHRTYTLEKSQKLDGKILSYKELETNFRI